MSKSKIHRVLVTGSSGKMGQVLCPFLMEQNYFVRGFDRCQSTNVSEFCEGDLLDRDLLTEVLKDMDAVIHLAAVSDDKADFEVELLPNNVLGLYKLLAEVEKQAVRRFILASSIQTVDFLNPGKSFSTVERSPMSFYGLTKTWGEDLAELYSNTTDLSIIIARFGWLLMSEGDFKEARSYPHSTKYYLSPGDMCQFFHKCLVVSNISFQKFYCTSIQKGSELFDLKPAELQLGYRPKDTFNDNIEAENTTVYPVEDSKIVLIQITDLHLFKTKNGTLHDVNTYERLKEVIRTIRDRQERIDAIIITGDLSEDGSTESYCLLKDEIQKLDLPSYWLPGNHDNFANIPENLRFDHVLPSLELDNWGLIFLDTTVSGEDYGSIGEKELNRLEFFLQAGSEKHVLICMHHHPVNVRSAFIDEIGLRNPDQFWELISKFEHAKGIIHGHVHQEFAQNVSNIKVSSSLSTCIQWKPGVRDFELDHSKIGFKTYTLYPDGEIKIGSERIQYNTYDLNEP